MTYYPRRRKLDPSAAALAPAWALVLEPNDTAPIISFMYWYLEAPHTPDIHAWSERVQALNHQLSTLYFSQRNEDEIYSRYLEGIN